MNEHIAPQFERCWAIVDLFGHQRIAGQVSEQTLAGSTFLRVDVPETEHGPAFTRFFGGSAVYSLSPCAEAIARELATRESGVAPVRAFELPGLTAPVAREDWPPGGDRDSGDLPAYDQAPESAPIDAAPEDWPPTSEECEPPSEPRCPRCLSAMGDCGCVEGGDLDDQPIDLDEHHSQAERNSQVARRRD